MTKDFNIRDRDWDLSYSHHLAHSDILIKITDSLKLILSSPVYQVLTQYANNTNNSNLVIDLMFFWPNSVKINNHLISSDFQLSLNHASLIDISIIEEFI